MTDTRETPPSSPVGRLLPIMLGITVVLTLFAWLVLPRLRPYQFNGTVIQSELPATDFTLTSSNGPVSLSDYRGKLVVLYFGYTFCPDVCPTTLSDVNKALAQLGNKAQDVQLIMVSVDHVAPLNVIDQEGHLKLVIGYGTGADAIAADLRYMLR